MGVSNIRPIGECVITYDTVDLGLTKGGCTLQIIDTIHKTNVDKYGSSPVKAWDIGVQCLVTTILVEHSWAILEKAYRSSGTKATMPDRITFGKEAGDEIEGKLLILHPRNEASHYYNVNVFKAVPELDSTIPFVIDGERVYPVKWFGLIDTGRTDTDLMFRIGNLS